MPACDYEYLKNRYAGKPKEDRQLYEVTPSFFPLNFSNTENKSILSSTLDAKQLQNLSFENKDNSTEMEYPGPFPWKTELTERAKTHILYGDRSGGGHMFLTKEKIEFLAKESATKKLDAHIPYGKEREKVTLEFQKKIKQSNCMKKKKELENEKMEKLENLKKAWLEKITDANIKKLTNAFEDNKKNYSLFPEDWDENKILEAIWSIVTGQQTLYTKAGYHYGNYGLSGYYENFKIKVIVKVIDNDKATILTSYLDDTILGRSDRRKNANFLKNGSFALPRKGHETK